MDVYTERDKRHYKPPACPSCGRRVEQDWLDVTCKADGDDRKFTPGRWQCATPGCSYNPSTLREAGGK